MHLSPAEFQQFRALQSALNNFIYAKLQEAKGLTAQTPFGELPFTKQMEVRQAFATDHSLIDQFIALNPQNLSYEELETVGDWRKMLTGKFYVLRHLKKHSLFLTGAENSPVYGVIGLTQPIEEVIGPDVPVLVDAILLPFLGRIVYDGLMERFPITFGPGIRRSLNDDYRDAKELGRMVTSLGPPAPKAAAVKTKPRKRAAKAAE